MLGSVVVILNMFIEPKELEKVTETLTSMPEVLDIYEVTGEYDLVSLVRTESISTFREFLKNKILRIKGVRSTVTSVVLHTHKKEGKLISG